MKIDGAQIAAQAASLKSGWKTSEFWTHTVLPLAGAALASIFGMPVGPVAAVVAGITTVAYGAGRVVLKVKQGDVAGAVVEGAETVADAVRPR